uniref:Uncharacterized protein n=1 Tax=Timema tahoe TaxID=61484 RepID=A0A7R9FJE3_9NEOP|nr:unnamed protein product [Timema tahoe]
MVPYAPGGSQHMQHATQTNTGISTTPSPVTQWMVPYEYLLSGKSMPVTNSEDDDDDSEDDKLPVKEVKPTQVKIHDSTAQTPHVQRVGNEKDGNARKLSSGMIKRGEAMEGRDPTIATSPLSPLFKPIVRDVRVTAIHPIRSSSPYRLTIPALIPHAVTSWTTLFRVDTPSVRNTGNSQSIITANAQRYKIETISSETHQQYCGPRANKRQKLCPLDMKTLNTPGLGRHSLKRLDFHDGEIGVQMPYIKVVTDLPVIGSQLYCGSDTSDDATIENTSELHTNLFVLCYGERVGREEGPDAFLRVDLDAAAAQVKARTLISQIRFNSTILASISVGESLTEAARGNPPEIVRCAHHLPLEIIGWLWPCIHEHCYTQARHEGRTIGTMIPDPGLPEARFTTRYKILSDTFQVTNTRINGRADKDVQIMEGGISTELTMG